MTISATLQELVLLRQTVVSQQLEIKTLQDKLAYVLSYLGIDNVELKCANEPANDPADTSDQHNINIGASKDRLNQHGGIGTDDDSAGFKTVIKQTRQHQQNKFQQSIVAADLRSILIKPLKQNRRTSLIVSGLIPSAAISDNEQFKQLCMTELNLAPNIVTTKRLGRLQQGRIQPLLVTLQQVDQVQ